MNVKTKRILIIILLLIICSIIVFLQLNNGNESILNKASKMILYESGNKIEVTKNTERYNKILKLIDMDFPHMYGLDPPVSTEEFETIKNRTSTLELNITL